MYSFARVMSWNDGMTFSCWVGNVCKSPLFLRSFFFYYFSCATTRIERGMFLSYFHLFRLLACTTRAGVLLFGFAPGFHLALAMYCTAWPAIFGLLSFYLHDPFLLFLPICVILSPYYSDFSMISCFPCVLQCLLLIDLRSSTPCSFFLTCVNSL